MKADRQIEHGRNGTYLETTRLSASASSAVSQFITIGNKGGDVMSTNYFDNPLALAGLYYLSGNAGVARLLVPDSLTRTIAEMQTGLFCVLTSGLYKGRSSIEIMFEDQTRAPFSLFIPQEQCDFRLQKSSKPFRLAAWTRTGKVGEWEAFERIGKRLPCLQPWK